MSTNLYKLLIGLPMEGWPLWFGEYDD